MPACCSAPLPPTRSVKAMEVDEKPTEDYSDIGGLDKQVRGLLGMGMCAHASWLVAACVAVVLGIGWHKLAWLDPTDVPAAALRCLQIQELREAIVLPITHRDRFVKLGIKPPKGVLLHGPPGACCRGWQDARGRAAVRGGPMRHLSCVNWRVAANASCPDAHDWFPPLPLHPTACARHGQDADCACMRSTDQRHVPQARGHQPGAGAGWRRPAVAWHLQPCSLTCLPPCVLPIVCFTHLPPPQMFIGDGAKMVRDAFALAKEKQPCIIFIDEIDSIGAAEEQGCWGLVMWQFAVAAKHVVWTVGG